MNNIKMLRKQRGLSQAQLADLMHVNQTAVSQWETERAYPSFDIAVALANYFGVSVEYMMGQSEKATSKGVRIPVLGRVRAGIPMDAIEEILDWEEIPSEMAKSGEYFALRVTGDSMEPRICDGDVLIVRKQETADTGDVVIALINGNDATVKRFKRTDAGVMLVPTNTAYDPLIFTAEEIASLPVQILGVVIENRQKYKPV